ncbi:MAG TPA: DnaJ C-terminal domain-containing protein [Ktedonobacteraceae bacterium]|nr:DnaJ C-terminal domain-containing protein [Ktedonobacteraceae bacterium]
MAFQDQQSGDIHATLAVSQEEALYGSSRVINLPDGRSTTVTVPAGTYDGQELRLAGQGSLITPGGPSGDLILRLQIVAGGDVRPGDDAATARASYHVPHDPSRASSAGAGSYPGWSASASPAAGASFASASTDADYSGSPAPARSAGPSPYTGYSGYAVPTTPSEGTPPYAASGGYPIPPLTPAYPQAPVQPPVKKRGKTILIAILALVVVVVVGSGLGLYFGYYQPGQARTLAAQTAQAQSSATAQAAGGTAQVVQATARAAATSTAQVQATAQAYQNIYTQATRGTPDLDDPLNSPSLSSLWSLTLGSTTDGSCTFTNGAYHSSIPKVGFFKPCYALDSDYSNFAFQVDMIITRGDSGGLLLRASSDHNKFYLLRISVDGSYSLYRYSSTQSGQATLLLKGSSQLIKGLNQSNELAVVARQSTLYIYVNHQYLGSASDNAYSSGEIGVFAESDQQATEAAFSHAKVWKL